MKIEKVNGFWVPKNDLHFEDWKAGKPFTQNKCLLKFIDYCVDKNKKFNHILDIGASHKFASIMHNISPCLKASRSNYYITNLQRKFTPRECLRLQGIPDNLFKQTCSDHQTYKQAGNSITVNVLEALLKSIFKCLDYQST